MLAEYDLTRRLVLAVTEHDRLLADRPVLSRAVELRDPYVDALSYLQLRALTALRAARPEPNASRSSACSCSPSTASPPACRTPADPGWAVGCYCSGVPSAASVIFLTSLAQS